MNYERDRPNSAILVKQDFWRAICTVCGDVFANTCVSMNVRVLKALKLHVAIRIYLASSHTSNFNLIY